MATTVDSIQRAISTLIEEKAKRDNIKFNQAKLADEIGVSRSIISRLLQKDPNKKRVTTNPPVDLLIKITDYFRGQGFNITLDDLLGRSNVDVQSQDISVFKAISTVPLYELSNPQEKVGIVKAEIYSKSKNLFAFISSYDIEPIFKSGSMFFVDPELKPTDNTLIAVKIDNSEEILIKNFRVEGHKQRLRSYNNQNDDITLQPDMDYRIIGVVVQVNPNTSP